MKSHIIMLFRVFYYHAYFPILYNLSLLRARGGINLGIHMCRTVVSTIRNFVLAGAGADCLYNGTVVKYGVQC